MASAAHGQRRAQTVGELPIVGVVDEAGRPQPSLSGPSSLGGFFEVVHRFVEDALFFGHDFSLLSSEVRAKRSVRLNLDE